MKAVFGVIILVLIGGALWYSGHNRNRTETTQVPVTQSVSPTNIYSPTPVVATQQNSVSSSQSVFVPAWATVQNVNELEKYDRVYLFSVAATETGLNTQSSDAQKILTLAAQIPAEKRWIVVAMTNSDTNLRILQNPQVQNLITTEIAALIQQIQPAGLLLDFELSALPSDELKNSVTAWYRAVDSAVGAVPFHITLFGDTFYRQRPYDVQALASIADEVVLMAYDFHKSRGEPGPNFPFSRGKAYPYDFQTMIQDFRTAVAPEKISIAYGMFGYDWLVDEKKRPIRPAKALSLNEIRQNFIEKCVWQNCLNRRDPVSAETEINYVDENGGYHIIWFEDEMSRKHKEAYAREQGIGDSLLWAYSYY